MKNAYRKTRFYNVQHARKGIISIHTFSLAIVANLQIVFNAINTFLQSVNFANRHIFWKSQQAHAKIVQVNTVGQEHVDKILFSHVSKVISR